MSPFFTNAQFQGRIDGVSLESPPFELNDKRFEVFKEINAEWVAVIPYGFSRENLPKVHYDSEKQWWGERLDGAAEMIKSAKANGLKIMLKPQVWIFRGWVGDYGFNSEEEWMEWESSYTNFILAFANLADSLDVELFCLGTEYRRAASERPDYWIGLIEKVRDVYKGKLTYAANWDEYEGISFWDKLDYIGVDAYFPLSEAKTPGISDLMPAWRDVKSNLKALSDKFSKPVLLAEYGYKSVDRAAGRQWELKGNPLNLEAQRKAYLALYEALWNEPWIAGGFFWKWQFGKGAGGIDDKKYTPQGKPALEAIKNAYR